MKIRYLIVSWTDVLLEPRDIPKLRGFFVNQFPEDHIFHNHLPGFGYNYKAPQIQYRVMEKHPALLAINDGIDIIKKVFLEVDKLEINGKTLVSNEREISLKEEDFGLTENYYTYFFASPWMALNQENYQEYNKMNTYKIKEAVLIVSRCISPRALGLKDCLNWVAQRIKRDGTSVE